MWPMLLDYTKDESKRILRRLELEAYASIISVFRAQGDLSKDKKKILQDLQQTLSISTERHRAEVRRAINDEKLATIADNIAGTISTDEWTIEGRRLVPLMPRLVPQTAFTATANQAATAMMEKNASLPPPSQTSNKDGPTAILSKPPRPSSPNSNVVVLPSGTSIHIKGMLNQDDEEELCMPSRRSSNRSLSTDSNSAASVSTQTPRLTYTTASSTMPCTSPVKITISKSPQGRPISVQSTSQPPKVILVTSAGPASGTTVIQRSMSVPVVRTPPTTLSTFGGQSLPRSSVLMPSGPVSSSVAQVVSAYPGIVTSTSNTSLVSTTVTIPSSTIGSSQGMFSPSVQIGLGKVRPRIVPRQRYPAMIPTQKPGVVIPMGPQLVSPSQNIPAGLQISQPQHSTSTIQVSQPQHLAGGIQVKTLNKPTIQIKQEGAGMKIITQSGSKILPKPSQITGTGGTPVVMVNAGQSTTGGSSGVTMLPRSISSYTAHTGGKVLNITTPGGRVIATTTKATNVVTVNPKTLHLTAVKSGSGSTTVSKPNVIVVQKTQHARFPSPIGAGATNIRTITTSGLPGAIDKELMGLVHKDAQGRHVLTASTQSVTTASTGRGGERRVIITTSSSSGESKQQPISIIHRGRTDGESKTSLLAELIQAVGMQPEGATVETTAQGTDPYEFENLDGTSQPVTVNLPTLAPFKQQQIFTRLPLQRQSVSQEVIEAQEEDTYTFNVHTEDKRESPECDSRTEQVFTLEQAMSLLNKEVVDLTEPEPPQITSSSILPSILTSASVIPPITHIHVQPKVSILTTNNKGFVSEVNKETPGPHAETVLGEVIVSPEGLKEGQLDTQTGLFYQVTASNPPPPDNYHDTGVKLKPPEVIYTTPQQTLTPPAHTSSTLPSVGQPSSAVPPSVTVTQPIDLLSSSLAEAQINLDSYNEEEEEEEDYDDEGDDAYNDMPVHSPVTNVGHILGDAVSSRPGMAEVLREETAKDGTRILTVTNPASQQTESIVTHGNLLVSLPSQLSRSTSLPSTASSVSSSPSSSSFISVQEVNRPIVNKPQSNFISVLPQVASSTTPSTQTNALPVSVTGEPSASVITLKLDELTSQRVGIEEDEQVISQHDNSGSTLSGTGDMHDSVTESCTSLHEDFGSTAGSDLESHSDGIVSADSSGLIRSSKRKRKHPSGLDEPSQAAPGSWVKAAASLLMKVARFKGSPRDRNEIPAAEWFTFPVDSTDAPDYYTVIQNPMDFSTMRKKLETGQYSCFEDFQSDMELIRTNCYLYNSEGTKVRRDCDEVMTFYRSELAKLQEKQTSKAFMQSASSPLKRPKADEKAVPKS
ncbi:BRCA2-interacting transcriptional repressor EMSY-like isoform X2 [Physella acuta]|uniref:BRCA2-interacting transcriptional repressor EMSY-like isoform X2 n=1 Tax=Physella acuta TaxID=109671 RepID=UPI0027DC8BA7|nr:BRCA2-interacting transcriptional repressor EMSY-like isoform X2 [Physella acuta]